MCRILNWSLGDDMLRESKLDDIKNYECTWNAWDVN